jgi:hypothetical protein
MGPRVGLDAVEDRNLAMLGKKERKKERKGITKFIIRVKIGEWMRSKFM